MNFAITSTVHGFLVRMTASTVTGFSPEAVFPLDVILKRWKLWKPKNSRILSFILSLYSSGLFNNRFGEISTETKKQIADAFELKDFVFEESLMDIQKRKAKDENQNIDKLENPLEIDGHDIHIEEHTKFLLTNSLDEDSKQKLLNHIKQHKNFDK